MYFGYSFSLWDSLSVFTMLSPMRLLPILLITLNGKQVKGRKGVCFAFQTFLSKVNAAVATFVFGQILDRTDFKAVDKSLVDTAGRQIFFEQSVNTQKMLLALVTIVPAIGFLLTIIPMFFNNYTGKVKEQAQKELEKKREKLMSDTEN